NDECFLGTHDCTQECINTEPNNTFTDGYICDCYDGFTMIDGMCQPNENCTVTVCVNGMCSINGTSETCYCNSGYTAFNETYCDDIDECDNDTIVNNEDHCEHNCINTEPDYICTCDDGYILNSDQRTCT
ncbi:collagen and calcium-binding EGF domain-containing protein 1-like, partial [Saccoglossus kowalevskii]